MVILPTNVKGKRKLYFISDVILTLLENKLCNLYIKRFLNVFNEVTLQYLKKIICLRLYPFHLITFFEMFIKQFWD